MTPSADGPGSGRPGASPYPGLAAFGNADEDAELFFGRTAERDLIIANLRSARLTVLYGASGVGKSSLLQAGVVHRLRAMASTAGDVGGVGDDGDDPRSPVIIIDDWSGDPAAGLTAAIRSAADDAPKARDSVASLVDALVQLRSRGGGAPLVILDQFEEYLRLHPHPAAGGFDDVLTALLTQPEVLVRVLIAVRDDRLAGLDRFEGRVPNLLSNFLRLGPLTREAAREAIVGPIERYNAGLPDGKAQRQITLEPGLADRVLDELAEFDRQPITAEGAEPRAAVRERGPLPASDGPRSAGGEDAPIEPAVLQLTMRRLWDADVATGGTTLRLATLEALGGAGRIFATHLDIEMAALPAAERRLAAEMLRFLVTPSGVTRSYSAADLSAYVSRPQGAVESLAEKLSRAPARILRAVVAPAGPGSPTEYELSHQVLARPALDWRSRFETERLERRARRLLLGVVTLSALALALVGYAVQPGPLRRLELSTVDQRFAVRGGQRPDRNIVLVTIDDPEYTRLVSSARPPRATIAAALDDIVAAQPRAIACDIIFTGGVSSSGDAALIRAVHRDGAHLVLATDVLDGLGETQLFGRPDQTFSDHTSPAVGYAGFPGNPGDPNTAIRTMQRSVALPANVASPGGGGSRAQAAGAMDTLAVVTARLAGRSPGPRSSLPANPWIAFRGGAGTFPSVSLDDVLRRSSATLSRLRDKIVVLGITAKAKHDVHKTSAPGNRLMSGPELQANAVSTALRGFPLRDGGRGLDAALIVILALVPLALGLLLPAAGCAIGIAAAAAVFLAGAQLAFDSGRVISVVFPLISLVLSGAGVLAVLLLRARAAVDSGSALGR